jgi:Putative Ig domain
MTAGLPMNCSRIVFLLHSWAYRARSTGHAAAGTLRFAVLFFLLGALAACGGDEESDPSADRGASNISSDEAFGGTSSNGTSDEPTNEPPQVWGAPVAKAVIGQTYMFKPQALDPDGDRLRYSVQNRPLWLSFDASSGRLSGMPTLDDVGTTDEIVITASDGELTDQIGPFSIDVVPANRPPLIGGTPPLRAITGHDYSFVPDATDLDGDTLFFSLENEPAWLTVDETTGRVFGSQWIH